MYVISKNYPYSESLEVIAKKEALEAGLYPNFAEFEWYNFSREEQELIKDALGGMKIQFKPSQGQRVWSEHYTYDNNSNRLTKTTKFGTINYTYDDENRLRYSGKENLVNLEAEIGGRITFAEDGEIYYAATSDSVAYNATSLKGTRYTYDANGNMLSSESLYSVKFFDYNENNRMKLSTVTDLIEHSYTATTYAYDGFGRRTLSQTQGETATRTLYDGTSFEILRQGTADSNGSFVNVAEAEQRQGYYPQTRGFGNHYNKHGFDDYFYYLFFGGIWGFGNGAHGSNGGKEEAPEYLSIENMYPIYANGSVSGTYTENLVYSPHQDYWNKWQNFWGADASKYDDYATYKETLYFGTDILGSVRSTSNIHSSEFGSVSYDIFGSPYQKSGSFLATDSLDFGYLGKPYNADTELYDYGFRDYSPEIARFTTVDPIRDGRNWFSYVVNDLVNYVDLWGLCGSDENKKIVYNTKFPCPVAPYFNFSYEDITSDFGFRINPITGELGSFHNGIDFAVPVGTEILSVEKGTIVEVLINDPIYGNSITIDHGNNNKTKYSHLSELYVSEGEVVEKATVIGLSGGEQGAYGSGMSTGPHLHFEHQIDGVSVDPKYSIFGLLVEILQKEEENE